MRVQAPCCLLYPPPVGLGFGNLVGRRYAQRFADWKRQDGTTNRAFQLGHDVPQEVLGNQAPILVEISAKTDRIPVCHGADTVMLVDLMQGKDPPRPFDRIGSQAADTVGELRVKELLHNIPFQESPSCHRCAVMEKRRKTVLQVGMYQCAFALPCRHDGHGFDRLDNRARLVGPHGSFMGKEL